MACEDDLIIANATIASMTTAIQALLAKRGYWREERTFPGNRNKGEQILRTFVPADDPADAAAIALSGAPTYA